MILFLLTIFTFCMYVQVDVEYKLQDTKKLAKEWEMKVKAFRKKLDDIQTNLVKHMDQYV